jgi:SPP1 family predicted phage head-tail adaptor
MSLKKSFRNGAGRRQTLVTVEVATSAAANGSYEVVPQYVTTFTRFAEEMITSGREFQQAMQTVASLQGILKLPYDAKTAAITARDRVTIGSRILELATTPINEGGRNELMVLWVVEHQ